MLTDAPTPASLLHTTVLTANTIDVAWQNNSLPIIGTALQASINGGAFTSLAGGYHLNGTSAEITGITPGTTVQLRVRTYLLGLTSDSAALTVVTLPSLPTNVAATPQSDTQIDVTWTAATGATAYDVQRSSNGTTWTTLGRVAAYTYSDTSAAAGATYSYRVRAVDVGGVSAYSAAVSGTTPSALQLNSMAVSDTNNGAYVDGTGQADLYIAAGTGSSISLVADGLSLFTTAAGAKTLWTVTQGDTVVGSGNFAGLQADVPIGDTSAGDQFVASAGIDANHDGILQSGEITQTVNVHAIATDTLTVSDNSDGSNSVSASDGSANDLYLAAGSDGTAQIAISASALGDDGAALGHLAWSVSGDGNDSASAADHTFGSGSAVVTLSPTSSNSDYTVSIGVDKDGSGDLSPDEVERIINVHVV